VLVGVTAMNAWDALRHWQQGGFLVRLNVRMIESWAKLREIYNKRGRL
jgi:hypothetical protein